MRPTLLLPLLSLSMLACAYPRRDTHLSPAPAGNLTSFDMPDDVWTLRLLGAELPPRKKTGQTWDEDGSGPDAFVRIIVDGRVVWESPVIEDALQPRWERTLPKNVVIPSDKTFRIEVWDDDGGLSGDPLGYTESIGLPMTAAPNAEANLVLSSMGTVGIVATYPRPHRGVGLSVEIHPDAMHVLSVLPYSPAARAGIAKGDRIVEIGPVYVSHMADEDALSRLSLAAERGEKLVVVGRDGTRREVDLDDKPLWLTIR